ncbi:MAG: universal stress protein, partial [Acidimicrobiales bacterium]
AEDQLAVQLERVTSPDLLPPVVVHGRPGPTLVDISEHANLLVVGTRGRGALADTILGSVSTHVASHATCPVAIVPEHAPSDHMFNRIVVGIDGSASSLHALEWATRLADDATTIEVVHTWSPMPAGALDSSVSIIDDLLAQSQRLAEDTVAKAAAHLGIEAKRFDVRVEMGDARNILRDISKDADLLVVGARGHRGVAHLLLGSVATGLVHQPLVPTIVVPNHLDA